MRIAIAGASGRMGQMLIEAVLAADGLELAVALDRKDSASLGQDAGAPLGKQTGVAITDNLDALSGADCLIDFTRPEGTLEHLQACVRHGVKAVIGTTGFDEAGRAAIEVAAQKTAIVFALNMSVGVNATLKLLDMAARILNSGYDVEVFEAHHRNKVDAPSGTALKMGETIASAWDVALPDVATWSRHGDTGVRKPGTIGFGAARRRHRGRPHRVVLRHRRTHRDHASFFQPRHLRAGRCAPRASWKTSTTGCTTCSRCWVSKRDPHAAAGGMASADRHGRRMKRLPRELLLFMTATEHARCRCAQTRTGSGSSATP